MEKTLLGWKAWYGDSSTYTSANNKWVDIPIEDFQYLKKFYDGNTDSFAGQDLYCITQDAADIKTLIDSNPDNIKIGKLLPTFAEWKTFDIDCANDTEVVKTMI